MSCGGFYFWALKGKMNKSWNACVRLQTVLFSVSSRHIYLPLFFLSPSFSSSFCFPPPVEDVNANPNKRQRQPALLGDHPPEYGKELVQAPAEENTHNKYRKLEEELCVDSLYYWTYYMKVLKLLEMCWNGKNDIKVECFTTHCWEWIA